MAWDDCRGGKAQRGSGLEGPRASHDDQALRYQQRETQAAGGRAKAAEPAIQRALEGCAWVYSWVPAEGSQVSGGRANQAELRPSASASAGASVPVCQCECGPPPAAKKCVAPPPSATTSTPDQSIPPLTHSLSPAPSYIDLLPLVLVWAHRLVMP